MNHTVRNFPRSMREAFPHDYQESAMGIEQPIQTAPTLFERMLRASGAVRLAFWRGFRDAWRFLMQRSPW